MRTLESRIEKIENRLSVDRKPLAVTIIFFGEGKLPPECTEDGQEKRLRIK